MYKRLEKRLALSPQGAKDFCKGVFFTTLQDIALMLPAIFLFIFLNEYVRPIIDPSYVVSKSIWFYIGLAVVFMSVMFVLATQQYKNTYVSVYNESATRRLSLAEKLRVLPLAFFSEKNLSDLSSTIMEDNTALEHTFSHAVPQLVASIISICLVAIGMFFYNWQLSIALFWVIPAGAAVILISKKMLKKDHAVVYKNKRDVTEKIQEGLDTIQEIKSYTREDEYIDELNDSLDNYEKILTRSELTGGVLVNSAQSILKLGMASVIILGAILLSNGTVDLFTYLMFLVISSVIYNPVTEVFNNMAALFYLDIRINRMNEMAALPIQDGSKDFAPDDYDIVFNKVNFSYETGKQVLDNVTFTARQGEVTALVGPSGGGKSTCAKLAARFWDVDSGSISLGNRNISEIDPETLLENYAVVFQDVVLFNASVMDNIRLGKRDATDEEVLKAAAIARCDDFVKKMPDGYNSMIGENGETLSGGERQRISIARAILKDAPIVLLDEATASLDVENETKIQAGLSALIQNKTVIIIAHRMRTVANADNIIVLKDGKVSECGTPAKLMAFKGLFAKMVARQRDKVDTIISLN